MTTGTLRARPEQQGLRPVDLRRDLGGIATLMDICFGDALDRAGRGVVREMQLLSRSGPLLWAVGAFSQTWQSGFVWVEGGRIVGNISVQPADFDRTTWLLANVAVHPDHRRRGIASALTEAALRMALERGAQQIRLQVNQTNTAAERLYRMFGFQAVVAQTVWERAGGPPPRATSVPGVEIRPARSAEWRAEFQFVTAHRPEGLSWVRPLRPADWKPSFWRGLGNFLSARREERWIAVDRGRGNLAAVLRIEIGFAPFDQISVVVGPEWRSRLERPVLIAALRRVGHRPWPVRVDHPADELTAPLEELGFKPIQTLIWMRKGL